MISRLDAYVGEIPGQAERKGLDENTIVIFSGDNGPHEGGCRPDILRTRRQVARPETPVLRRRPPRRSSSLAGKVKASEVNDHQLAFYDIMPTFCRTGGRQALPKVPEQETGR